MSTITVEAVNDAPVLDLDDNDSTTATDSFDYRTRFSFDGDAIAIGDIDVAITDVDDTNIESATITLTNPLNGNSESLSISGTLPTGISASTYDSATGTITLTGSASLADYQTAINQIVYDNNEPGGLFNDRDFSDRTVTVVVSDGDVTSNTATTTIVLDNNPPTLDLNGGDLLISGANYTNTFTEDAGAVAIVDTDVAIADSDGDNINTATITLTNTQTDDRFVIDGTPVAIGDTGTVNGINYEVVDNGGQLEIQLTGSTTTADYQTALQLITFENISDTPNTTNRNIEIVVSDGLESSPIRSTTISVIPVNDPPEIDLDSSNDADNNYATTFVEGAGSISISDVDPLIVDGDDTNIESATIVLQNAQAGDVLTVGTLPGGITASVDDSVAGQVTVTLSNSATLEQYQQAIAAISFNNTSDAPDTTPRQIDVIVNDGDAVSNTATTTINITAVNSPPVIDLNSSPTTLDYATTYTEGATPVSVVDLTNPDAADPEDNITELTIDVDLTSVLDNGDGTEQIIIGGTTFALNTDVSTPVTVTYGGTTFGITYDSASGQFTIVDNDTANPIMPEADLDLLLQNITYEHTSINPTAGDRTLSFTATDSDGATSDPALSTITVIPVNETPVINLDPTNTTGGDNDGNYEVSIVPGNPVNIAETATATGSDADGTDIDFLELTVAGILDGNDEQLFLGDTPVSIPLATDTGATPIDVTVDGVNYQVAVDTSGADPVVTISKANSQELTQDEVQDLLRGITYDNTATTPTTGTPRTISLVLNDGTTDSNTVTSTISVEENAPPVANNDSYTVPADTTFTAILGSNDLLLNDTDPNNDTLSATPQTLTTANGGSVEIFADGTFTYNPNGYHGN